MQEPNQIHTKSKQKAEAILISIAVGTVVIIFVILGRTPESVELPNKATLAVELGTGAFIAYLLYYYQERSNKSLKDLVEELHEYNELRKKHDESVRDPLLKRMDGFLCSFKEQIGIDMDNIRNMEPTEKRRFVTDLLLGYYSRVPPGSAFDGPEKVKELEKESTYVMQYVVGDLRENLRSIIENIEIMYGLKVDLSGLLISNQDPPERWVEMSNKTLSKIESARGSIKGSVRSQQSESGKIETDSNN